MSSEYQSSQPSVQSLQVYSAGDMQGHERAESLREGRGDQGDVSLHPPEPSSKTADTGKKMGEDACRPKNQKILRLGRGGLALLAIFIILNTVIYVFTIIYIGNALSALSQAERPRENITVVVIIHDVDSNTLWNAVSNTLSINGTADNSCGSSGFNATCNCLGNTHIFIRNDTRANIRLDKGQKRNK